MDFSKVSQVVAGKLNINSSLSRIGLVMILLWMGWVSSASGAESVTLAWDKNPEPNIRTYRLHLSMVGTNYQNRIDAGNVTSFTVRNLESARTYEFRISAENTNSQESEISQAVSWTAPTELDVVEFGGQVGLWWKPVLGPVQYLVKRSTSAGGPFQVIATNLVPYYLDASVVSGQRYFYTIHASVPLSVSRDSIARSAQAGVAPTGLVVQGQPAGLVVAWTAYPGAVGYRVIRSSSEGSLPVVIATNLVVTSFVDTQPGPPAPGGIYPVLYAVAAILPGGTLTSYTPLTSQSVIPQAPSALVVERFAVNTASFKWNAISTGIEGFLLEKSTEGQSQPERISISGSARSYILSGLTSGLTYSFRLFATNKAGFSPASAGVSIVVPTTGANVIFGPPRERSPVTGYDLQGGELFGSVAAEPRRGWLGPMTNLVMALNPLSLPDARYGGFAVLEEGDVWEIEVPNGVYLVRLVAGDQRRPGADYQLTVEGIPTPVLATDSSFPWADFEKEVVVSDGRLSVGNRRFGTQVPLCFVEIYPEKPKVPVLDLHPANQSIVQGRTLRLVSTVQSGTEPLDWHWYFNSVEIANARAQVLELPGITTNNAGDYFVVVSNEFGSATSRVAQIRVDPANLPPTLDPIPSMVLPSSRSVHEIPLRGISAGRPGETTKVTLVASAENTNLITRAEVLTAANSSEAVLRLTTVPNARGSSVVSVVADDHELEFFQTIRRFTVSFDATGKAPILMEAEAGSFGNSLGILTDKSASGGKKLRPVSEGGGSGSFPVQIDTAGIYFVWVRIWALDLEDRPFEVKDELDPATIGAFGANSNARGSWRWHRLVHPARGGPQEFRWSRGIHTLGFTSEASNFQLDALYVTPDPGFLPDPSLTNRPPTLTRIPDQRITENSPRQTLILEGITSGEPADPQKIAVTAISSNPALIPNPSVDYRTPGTTARLIYTPARNNTGTAAITVTVGDGGEINNQIQMVFLVIVEPVSAQPILSSFRNLTVVKGQPVPQVPFTVFDSATPLENLILSATSSNTALVGFSGLQITGDSSNRFLNITPYPRRTGSTFISIKATDHEGLSSTNSFNFTIVESNTPPFISGLVDLQLPEDSRSGLLDFVVSDDETPAAQLVVSVDTSNATLLPRSGLVVTGEGSLRTLQIMPVADRSGEAVVTLSVDDRARGVAELSFKVTVVPVNDPPTLDPIPDQTYALSTETVRLNLNGISAGGGEIQNLRIRAISGDPAVFPDPQVIYTNGSSRATLLLGPFKRTASRIPVTVNIEDGGEINPIITQTFSVTITSANTAPSIEPVGDQLTLEDLPLEIPIRISDRESSPRLLTTTFSVNNLDLFPPGSLFISGTGSNRVLKARPAPNQAGNASLNVMVSDGSASNRTSFQISVLTSNEPPTLDVIPHFSTNATTARVSHVINLTGITGGPAGESRIMTLEAFSSDTNLFPNPTARLSVSTQSGTLTIRPNPGLTGVATVSVLLLESATNGLSVRRSFNVHLSASTNTPPVVTPVPPITLVRNGSSATNIFTVFDAETPASELIVSARSSNPDLIPDDAILLGGSGTNRTLALSSPTGASGSASILVTVLDQGFAASSLEIPVTVTPANHPPELTRVPDISLAEDSGLMTIPVEVSDVETPAVSLIVTVSSDNPELLPGSMLKVEGAAHHYDLVFQTAPERSGTATITLAVSDGELITRHSFKCTVLPVNDPPSLTLPSLVTLIEDEPAAEIPIQLQDQETPDLNLQLSATSSDEKLLPASNISFGKTGEGWVMRLKPAPGASGACTILCKLSDGTNSTFKGFDAVVLPVNDPPTIDPIPDLLIPTSAPTTIVKLSGISAGTGESGEFVKVVASSSDASIIPHPLPGALKPDGTADLVLSPVFGASGSVQIEVRVNDGRLTNNTVIRSFRARVNQSPSISAVGDLILLEDQSPPPIAVVLEDRDDDPLQLTLAAISSNPGLIPSSGITFNGSSGRNRTLSITPASNAAGSTLITLVATDPAGGTATTQFRITFLESNDPPTLDPIPDQKIQPDEIWRVVQLSGISSGAANENQSLAVTAFSSNPGFVDVARVEYSSPATTASLVLVMEDSAVDTAEITVEVLDFKEGTVEGINRFSRTFKVERSSQPVSPEMRVESVAEGILISWDATQGANFVLQTAPALAEPQVWTRTNLSPVLTNGRYQLVIPISTQAAFFRLCASCVDQ